MKRRGLPKYVSEFQNRHDVWTVRFRRKGWPTIYPKAKPGTDEFADEYRRWLAGQPQEIGSKRTRPGSLKALAASYFNSLGFVSMKATTQGVYRNIINRLCEDEGSTGIKVGDMPSSAIRREHVIKLMAKRAAKPDSANGLRKVLRAMMAHAVEAGIRKDDPTQGVKPIKVKTDGFHSWTEAEIEKFEQVHGAGSKGRLALALLLYTGQRRGDVVRMGRQHMRDGFLSVKQEKTGTELSIPVLPVLQSVIDETPKDNMSFLVTELGRPFTSAGFGNWFKEQCYMANLPHCSAHGLRKAASRRLAEYGCTVHEVAAITGHASLREVQRYTRGADQKRLASAAIEKVKNRTSGG
jgi:integrase